ncbi:MAG TPA: hypothetical protein VK870_10910 [Ignavibacteriaceae bacterium]|nr:hypothetical protein [Ignavibacteriaceae bacterium]
MQQYDINTLNSAEDFTNSVFSKKDDILVLISESYKNNKVEIFEELCFTGKYVNGLMRVLKIGSNNPEVKSLDHIKKDLSDNIEKVINQLREITLNSSIEVKDKFEKKYFTLSTDTFKNLTELVSDLDALKRYINYLKRSN